MLNRKNSPEILTADRLNIIEAEKTNLSNGIPVYSINAGKQELVKIEFLFKAGTIFNQNPLIADITNSMLDEGTANYESKKIAEEIDFYGAFLRLNTGKHTASITVYTLNKYLDEVLNIISEIITKPVFPDKELAVILNNEYQSYRIQREKTENIASEKFWESIFGANTSYGRTIKEADFKNITSASLSEFHRKAYNLKDMQIIISGNISDNHYKVLQKYFGSSITATGINTFSPNFNFAPIKEKQVLEEKAGAVQTSIRIGKMSIKKNHYDYIKLSITNMILGGYFGSRLMTNIREDKGYTYGIYSSSGSLINSGYFLIQAETGKEFYQKAVDEIFKELKLLRTELVSSEELKRVKNYIIGNFITDFDGAFALSTVFKSILSHNLTYDYYYKFFDTVKNITSQEIQETANKYLQPDDMKIVAAGSFL